MRTTRLVMAAAIISGLLLAGCNSGAPGGDNPGKTTDTTKGNAMLEDMKAHQAGKKR